MPPAPSLTAGLLVCGFFFFLVPLLKCVLARWFLDVGFQIIFFQITVILETDIVPFGAQNQSFGMPPLWHPGGPWDDPGAPGGSRKETLGSRLGF